MNYKKLILITIGGMIILSLQSFVLVKGQITSFSSNYAVVNPTIDGTFTESEWQDASHVSFYHDTPSAGHAPDYVHIYIKNSANKLYLLFDDLPDNTTDAEDHVYVYFDCNYDNIIDENITMRLDRDHTNGVIGNSMAKWELGFSSSPNKAENHTIIEIEINITLDSHYDGTSRPDEMNHILPVGNSNKTIRIMFSATEYLCGWEIPQNVSLIDPTTYAELTFTSRPPGGGISSYPIFLFIGILMTAISLIIGKKFSIEKDYQKI